jgi:hypothetical protein
MATDDNLGRVSRNGKHTPPRPRIELSHSPASPSEAAAIAAAIEQFLRDTAPPPNKEPATSEWLKAGLREGVGICAGDPTWSRF